MRHTEHIRRTASRGEALLAVAAGTALALLLGKALSSMLFDVAPADPLVLGGVVVVLVAATLLASYVPARRATRVDPMNGLRCE